MTAVSAIVTCEHNTFKDFIISNFSYGVWSDHDINKNKFDNGVFTDLYQGIVFGTNTDKSSPGQLTGPLSTTVESCTFYWILRHGISITAGTGNVSNKNRFLSVGNIGSSSVGARFPHITFVDPGNKSTDDRFDREDEMEVGNTYLSAPYAPVVNGPVDRSSFTSKNVNVSYNGATPTLVIRLPIPVTSEQGWVNGTGLIGYEITYTYKSSFPQSRFGKMFITVDVTNNLVQLVDEYEWVGTSGNDENLVFTAAILDANNDTHKDCIGISYVNATNNDVAVMSYSYRSLS